MNGQKIEIGTVFGTYTVIGSDIDPKNNVTNYLLRCNCGYECKKIGYYVRKNRKCRKCNINKIIGTKNNKCTFLKYISYNKFECICDCGTKFVGRQRSKSCGCHIVENHIADAKTLEGYKTKYIKILKFLFFKKKHKGQSNCAVYSAKCGCKKVFEIERPHIEIIKSCGCKQYVYQAKGEKQGNSSHSDEQIKAVIDFYLSGLYSQEEIISMTGVTPHVFRAVIKNRGWKHIEVDKNLLEKSPVKELFRPPKKKNIIPNEQYNNWTVITKAPSKHKRAYWLCKCKCGHQAEVPGSCLVLGKSKQCENCHREYFVKRYYLKNPSLTNSCG